jgi:hypothetical protein
MEANETTFEDSSAFKDLSKGIIDNTHVYNLNAARDVYMLPDADSLSDSNDENDIDYPTFEEEARSVFECYYYCDGYSQISILGYDNFILMVNSVACIKYLAIMLDGGNERFAFEIPWDLNEIDVSNITNIENEKNPSLYIFKKVYESSSVRYDFNKNCGIIIKSFYNSFFMSLNKVMANISGKPYNEEDDRAKIFPYNSHMIFFVHMIYCLDKADEQFSPLVDFLDECNFNKNNISKVDNINEYYDAFMDGFQMSFLYMGFAIQEIVNSFVNLFSRDKSKKKYSWYDHKDEGIRMAFDRINKGKIVHNIVCSESVKLSEIMIKKDKRPPLDSLEFCERE